MSRNIQFILMAFYLVLSVASCIEHNFAKALYWFGAIVLSTGVILMR